MKKLKLNLNELKVESFEISSEFENKGTVNGNEIWPNSLDHNVNTCVAQDSCVCPTAPVYNGCEYSDATNCGNSCQGTCGDYTCHNYTCNGTCPGQYPCDL